MSRKKGDGSPAEMSLSEVADVLGVSGERIRQIEVSALNKIRNNIKTLGIIVDDLAPEAGQNGSANETELCTEYSNIWIK